MYWLKRHCHVSCHVKDIAGASYKIKQNKKYVLSNSESVQCNFFIFDHVTFIQFKICCCVQNFIKIGWFFYWDMAIYLFSKWRPSAILELFYHRRRPPTKSLLLAVKSHVNLIHRSEDIAIWIFRIFGLKCLFRLWGILDPNVTIHQRDPQKAHPCVNPRLLSYQL